MSVTSYGDDRDDDDSYKIESVYDLYIKISIKLAEHTTSIQEQKLENDVHKQDISIYRKLYTSAH